MKYTSPFYSNDTIDTRDVICSSSSYVDERYEKSISIDPVTNEKVTNITINAPAGDWPSIKTRQIADIIAIRIVISKFLKKPTHAKINAFFKSCLNDSLNVTIITNK